MQRVIHRKLSQKALYIIYGSIFVTLLNLIFISNTYADNIDYSVTIAPSLNLTTSASDITLNLNPATHPFDSKDLTVSVGTNNETGYKLYVNTLNNTTNLVEENDSSLVIPTLSSSVTETNFTENRWGYKLDSTATSYSPFSSSTLISSSDIAVNDITTTMSFAARAGYATRAGTYNLALNFQATANPIYPKIQDFTKAMCQEQASNSATTVIDIRDDNEYQVRYINGNCWMAQNLRYVGDTGSTSGSMAMKSATSNINTNKTITYTDLTSGDTYDEARLHVATSDQVPSGASYTATDMGVWYNYAAASAMTIIGSSNTNPQTYDVCPKGWRLPTHSEQSGIISHRDAFSPIANGYYYNGVVNDLGQRGNWWAASIEEGTDTNRDVLGYYDNALYLSLGMRTLGRNIRCIRSS